MDATQTCELVLSYIKKSNLNWSIAESPFTVTVTLKKSFIKNKDGSSRESGLDKSSSTNIFPPYHFPEYPPHHLEAGPGKPHHHENPNYTFPSKFEEKYFKPTTTSDFEQTKLLPNLNLNVKQPMQQQLNKTSYNQYQLKTFPTQPHSRTILNQNQLKSFPNQDQPKTSSIQAQFRTTPTQDQLKTFSTLAQLRTTPIQEDQLKTFPTQAQLKTIPNHYQFKSFPNQDQLKISSTQDQFRDNPT